MIVGTLGDDVAAFEFADRGEGEEVGGREERTEGETGGFLPKSSGRGGPRDAREGNLLVMDGDAGCVSGWNEGLGGRAIRGLGEAASSVCPTLNALVNSISSSGVRDL